MTNSHLMTTSNNSFLKAVIVSVSSCFAEDACGILIDFRTF